MEGLRNKNMSLLKVYDLSGILKSIIFSKAAIFVADVEKLSNYLCVFLQDKKHMRRGRIPKIT